MFLFLAFFQHDTSPCHRRGLTMNLCLYQKVGVAFYFHDDDDATHQKLPYCPLHIKRYNVRSEKGWVRCNSWIYVSSLDWQRMNISECTMHKFEINGNTDAYVWWVKRTLPWRISLTYFISARYFSRLYNPQSEAGTLTSMSLSGLDSGTGQTRAALACLVCRTRWGRSPQNIWLPTALSMAYYSGLGGRGPLEETQGPTVTRKDQPWHIVWEQYSDHIYRGWDSWYRVLLLVLGGLGLRLLRRGAHRIVNLTVQSGVFGVY